MIHIGKINTLIILRESDVGLFLSDDDGREVLLPNSFLKSKYKINELIDVFIYTDLDNHLIATFQKPYTEINSFAYLRVTSITEFGAFLDWGIEKDLFVPFNEQKIKMNENDFYVVYVYLDEKTNRIVGSNRIEKFLKNETIQLKESEEVKLLVFNESELGFSVIVNGTYQGLIYHNDIYKDVFIGDEMIGYVKNIREDNLIDISFQKSGFKNVLDSTEVILDCIKKNNGFLNLHDKSSPEEISIKLSMSKATFKKSIGILYRHRKILIKLDGVYLVEETKKNN